MTRTVSHITCLLLLSMSLFAASATIIADFEGADYGAWKVSGEAFGQAPAHGTLPNQMEVSGFIGKGLANSYNQGDGAMGTLTSPEFTISRKYINLLVGGGNHPNETCVNLLINGQVVRTTTGRDDERLDWRTWDVSEFNGKAAKIVIVDKSSTGWGHITADQITQDDTRQQQEINVNELYNETYRPQFHFSAKRNWLNDPNGLVFYKGEHHLFFQHNPKGVLWGNMSWGHAVSPDLVHWQELPIALLPDEHGTCFSGSAVVDWNNTAGFQTGDEKAIVAMYTGAPVPEVEGGPKFTQCLAYSNDRGRTWTRYDKNPVVEHIVGANRDPRVFWYAPKKQWFMALYLDKNDFAIFSSPNLKEWQRLQDITLPETAECPDMFPLAVDGKPDQIKWVFLGANGHYIIGSFDGDTFRQENEIRVSDCGANFYASQTYNDMPPEDGRRIQIAWMNGGKYPEMPFNQQMSFPCELTLRTFPEGIRLCRQPIREIDSLRGPSHRFEELTVNPGDNPLADIPSELLDIRATIDLGSAKAVGFRLHGETVKYDVAEKKLSCLGRPADLEPYEGQIQLQILLDRTSIEIFAADGRVSMTSCFLPQNDKTIGLFAEGGSAKIVSADIFELRPIWPR